MLTMNKKNILITGSSKGIGLAIAKHLAKTHNVYILGRYKEKLEKLVEENSFKGYFALDLFDANSISQINIDVDVLINNAGVYFYSPLEKMNEEEMDKTIQLNSLAPLKLSKAVLPYMKKRKS